MVKVSYLLMNIKFILNCYNGVIIARLIYTTFVYYLKINKSDRPNNHSLRSLLLTNERRVEKSINHTSNLFNVRIARLTHQF